MTIAGGQIVVPCPCTEAPQHIKAALEAQFADLVTEWRDVEPTMHLAVEIHPQGSCKALDLLSTQRVLDLFAIVPHGVLRFASPRTFRGLH